MAKEPSDLVVYVDNSGYEAALERRHKVEVPAAVRRAVLRAACWTRAFDQPSNRT
jgi:hypothetical protein